MKLIILEGQDNLGKTTIIREICKNYKSFIVRKFSNPPAELNLFEKEKFQQQNFLDEFRFYASVCKAAIFDQKNSVMIWDRSHLGEQVYGPIYRKSNPTKWLHDLEKIFKLNDVYLILLEAHYDFVVRHEDGHSLTLSEEKLKEFVFEFNGDNKLKTFIESVHNSELDHNQRVKKIEAALFRYGFDKSIIPNKISISVDHENDHRNINEIMKEIKPFINV